MRQLHDMNARRRHIIDVQNSRIGVPLPHTTTSGAFCAAPRGSDAAMQGSHANYSGGSVMRAIQVGRHD